MISLFKLFLAPSKKQTEFLSMIFNPDTTYWQKWLDKNKIEEIEPWVFFFLPIMHRRFQELKLEHPSLNIIRGVYKKSIYRNQLFIRELLKLNSALKAKGIDPIFLTELSIYFRGPSQPRYLGSVDILLPKCKEVYEVLNDLIWSCAGKSCFNNSNGFRIVIRWQDAKNRVRSEEVCEYRIDRENSVKLISTESVFVFLCGSCSYVSPKQSISWAYDLWQLLRLAELIEWQKVFELASETCKSIQVGFCLGYLKVENFRLIPQDYSQRLKLSVGSYLEFMSLMFLKKLLRN